MPTEKGMSILEIIFSIGVVVLVITGTVSLMVKSTSVKTNTFSRKEASEIAERIIENLVDKKNNNRDEFWQLEPVLGETLPQFENYIYNIDYTQVTDGDCSDSPPPTCVNALIKINWGDNQTLEVKRFFSKLYY